MDPEQPQTRITGVKAISLYFNTEGYEKLTTKELLELKKDGESFNELATLAEAAVNKN